MKTLEEYCASYSDSEDVHKTIGDEFVVGTNSCDYLKAHRDFIEESYRNGVIYGHGDRALQYMWKLVVDSMPSNFSFLEVGVYKGQILSLMEMLASKASKNVTIVGVTPLMDPDFASYNRLPYIENIYRYFGLSMERTEIIDGSSHDSNIVQRASSKAPYDVVYIDGDHSYTGTVQDIVDYGKMVRPGGLLVIDDASNYKKLPSSHWPGILDVSNAVRDILEPDASFQEILTVKHVRIFRKVGK